MSYKHGYSAALVEKGRKILDSDDEIGIIKDNFLELLMENGIGRDVVMKVEDLLVHPSNRGGLLVNAFNSHKNGSMVRRVGANKKELHGAVCMEMSPDPKKRKDLEPEVTQNFKMGFAAHWLNLEPIWQWTMTHMLLSIDNIRG